MEEAGTREEKKKRKRLPSGFPAAFCAILAPRCRHFPVVSIRGGKEMRWTGERTNRDNWGVMRAERHGIEGT